MPQIQKDGSEEPGLVTSGDDMACVLQYLAEGADSYPAEAVVQRLLSQVPANHWAEEPAAPTPGTAPTTAAAGRPSEGA